MADYEVLDHLIAVKVVTSEKVLKIDVANNNRTWYDNEADYGTGTPSSEAIVDDDDFQKTKDIKTNVEVDV